MYSNLDNIITYKIDSLTTKQKLRVEVWAWNKKKTEVISTQRTTARKQNGTEQKKIHVEASNTCTFQNWWNENKKWWIKISVYLWHLEQQLLLLAINPKSQSSFAKGNFSDMKKKRDPSRCPKNLTKQSGEVV